MIFMKENIPGNNVHSYKVVPHLSGQISDVLT